MAAESAAGVAPPGFSGDSQAFGEIIKHNFGAEAALGLTASSTGVEHPFGDGFLVALPEAAKKGDPTPAPVLGTSTDNAGKIIDVKTGSPD